MIIDRKGVFISRKNQVESCSYFMLNNIREVIYHILEVMFDFLTLSSELKRSIIEREMPVKIVKIVYAN